MFYNENNNNKISQHYTIIFPNKSECSTLLIFFLSENKNDVTIQLTALNKEFDQYPFEDNPHVKILLITHEIDNEFNMEIVKNQFQEYFTQRNIMTSFTNVVKLPKQISINKSTLELIAPIYLAAKESNLSTVHCDNCANM